MRLFLLFISIILSSGKFAALGKMIDGSTDSAERCAFDIQMSKGHISGILVMKNQDDDVIKGTMMNEFGVTALSFTCDMTTGKVRLRDVIPFLDKWYIRRVLRRDIKFFIDMLNDTGRWRDDRNYDKVCRSDSVLTFNNIGKKIRYEFTPLPGHFFELQSAAARVSGTPFNIWEGTECEKSVRLTPYLATGDSCPAVIVCPGGSYFWHDMKTEGREVAEWLRGHGVSAFVLEYRVGGIPAFITHSRLLHRGNRYPDMLQDLQRSIQIVREKSGEYGIDPNKLGVMGFSAGGHLAGMSGIFFDCDILPQAGVGTLTSLRPDYIAMIYPVVSFDDRSAHKRSMRGILGEWNSVNRPMKDSLSLEKHIRADMPPVFLVNCKDDRVVDCRNSVLMDSALTAAGVKHVYIQYPTGGHGFGASTEKAGREASGWKDEFFKWLDTIM